MLAQFPSPGFELFPLSFLVVVGLLVMAVVAVAGRAEPDPSGRRAYGVYLFLATFVALVATLGAVQAILSGLGRIAIVGDDFAVPYVVEYQGDLPPDAPLFPGGGGFVESGRRESARAVTEATVVAVAGFLLLGFHARRARDLADDPDYRDGPGRRTYQTYLYGTLFVLAFALAAAAVAAARGLLAVAFGETLAFGGRDAGFRDFVVAALFGGALAFLFRYHWTRAEALRTPATTPIPLPEPPAPTRPRPARPRPAKPAAKRGSARRRPEG